MERPARPGCKYAKGLGPCFHLGRLRQPGGQFRGQPVTASIQLGDTHRAKLSFPEACQKECFGFFESGDGLLAGNTGVLFQEFIQRISALQVVEKRLKRNAGTTENGLAAQDLS
jgi:hypothetical protein